MPGFHHPVVQALTCDGQTIELPGKADGEVCNDDKECVSSYCGLLEGMCAQDPGSDICG